jgi:regulator-associated protein of mTOR
MNRTESEQSLSTRSRLLGSSEHETLLREGIIPSQKVNEFASNPRLKQLKNYFSNNIFLDDEWHSEEYLHIGYEELKSSDSSWRLREKMRTVGVALVVCLNIGIDPPDLFKPNPCAKKECWFDPTGQKQKGLEYIGNALQQQYEKWQSKAKYKLCLDPTSEDLRRVCMNLRKASRTDRLLLHYNGHGVPKPTKNGELWVFGKHYTHYTPVAICELRSWLGDPAIYVLDCSAAGLLIPHLVDNMNLKDSDMNANSYDSHDHHSSSHHSSQHINNTLRENNSSFSFISQAASDSATIVLAACKGTEQLPFHPMYPVDIFTSCLTTPTTIAIRWFVLQVLLFLRVLTFP